MKEKADERSLFCVPQPQACDSTPVVDHSGSCAIPVLPPLQQTRGPIPSIHDLFLLTLFAVFTGLWISAPIEWLDQASTHHKATPPGSGFIDIGFIKTRKSGLIAGCSRLRTRRTKLPYRTVGREFTRPIGIQSPAHWETDMVPSPPCFTQFTSRTVYTCLRKVLSSPPDIQICTTDDSALAPPPARRQSHSPRKSNELLILAYPTLVH